MAKTVGSTGRLRITLVGAAAEFVTFPSWARRYRVTCESVAAVRIGPDGDASAVEGSTSPAQYESLAVGFDFEETLPRAAGRARIDTPGIWLYSAGAAVVVVSVYESV